MKGKPVHTGWTEGRLPLFLVRLLHYEYWPWWVLYLPMLPYWLWLSARARSLAFFTAANPGIEAGGFFGERKAEILSMLDDRYKAKTVFIPSGTPAGAAQAKIREAGIGYPHIAKPDVGERGNGVYKIDNEVEWLGYCSEYEGRDILVQEFVDFPVELGVLYSRDPGQKGRISSVAGKEFLAVSGDGKSTVLELLCRSDRGRMQAKRLLGKKGNGLDQVVPAGEARLVEPIGNHCLGTMFINRNDLINDKLSAVFDRIAIPAGEFYYGRFDLKVASIPDLMEGRNIRILELNGVSADPAHIFDPRYALWQAYRDLAWHWKAIARISRINRQRGFRPMPLWQLARTVHAHFRQSGRPVPRRQNIF